MSNIFEPVQTPIAINAFRGKDGVDFVYLGTATKAPNRDDLECHIVRHNGLLSPFTPVPLTNGTYARPYPIMVDLKSRAVSLRVPPEQADAPYTCNLFLGKISDDGKFVRLSEEGINRLQALASEKAPFAHAKIRQGATKLITLLQWVAGALTALLPEGGNHRYEVDEVRYKVLVESQQEKAYHVYRTARNGEYSVAQYSAIIGEVYRLHERTQSTSCMTKGDFYEDKGRSDFYDTDLHPFHSYNTKDWDLYLISEHAPDEVQAWEKDKSPFLARSWGWTSACNGKELMCNAGRSYGADEQAQLLNKVLTNYWSNHEATVRLYADCSDYNFSMPYIDGDIHTVGSDDNCVTEITACGYEYLPAVVCNPDEYEHIWEVNHETGEADEVSKVHECEICGDYFDEDEMVFIGSIEGWVHSRFYSPTNSDELDGLEILRYFR